MAHRDSQTKASLVPWPSSRSQCPVDLIQNVLHLVKVWRMHGPFDLIHSFARLAYLLPVLPRRVPKIQSYQRHIARRSIRWGRRLSGSSLTFTACSQFLVENARIGHERWQAIYNGVPMEKYKFRSSVPADAPLVFLGRLERVKGPHHAIAVAKRTGRTLILAGNHAKEGPEADFFKREIAPHIDDVHVCYVGPVDDAAKNELLGKAAGVLFPVEWAEPCGIVMAEALACGTPVLAINRGSVPEIIEHGVTGWVAASPDGLDEGVEQLQRIDRKACRMQAEQRFSSKVIAGEYLSLYYSLIQNGSSSS